MKTQETLMNAIENRKAGIYKSYYLQKSTEISNDENEIVFAYRNGRGSGYISAYGINHLMYIPKSFFENKSSDFSLYIGETEKYVGEESGLLHELYQTTIHDIIQSINEENEQLDKEYEEVEKQILIAEKKQAEFEEAFNAAKPTDLIDSGFGYMVEKRNYHLAQKCGYDGIELIN